MALTLTELEDILEREITKYTDQGWKVKPGSRTHTDAVLIPGNRKSSAAADGCLTIAWLGFWIIPAMIGAAAGKYSKTTIHINTDGSVLIRGPKLPR